MTVAGISVDPGTGSAVLALSGPDEQTLVIAIGLAEATSIATELEGVELPRPLSHDLLREVIERLGAKVVRVEIVDLRANTFFAELILAGENDEEIRVDSRPSDGIALAVRADAPIFVHERVLRKAHPTSDEPPPTSDKEAWKQLLEEMAPEDFGKYKM